MSRTLNDIKFQREFPPKGKYGVSIVGIEKGLSAKKKTPQITLIFSSGENEFDDNLYVTEKTLSRLCLVAKRVCLMPKETILPDNDKDASNFVAKYIYENALGKRCLITIEEAPESYVCESGPDIGQTKTIIKRRVAFGGYDEYIEIPSDQNAPHNYDDSDIPF